MELAEAKTLRGQEVQLTWNDRHGRPVEADLAILDLTFVPFYGPCLVTDQGDIALTRIISCTLRHPTAPASQVA